MEGERVNPLIMPIKSLKLYYFVNMVLQVATGALILKRYLRNL